MTHPLIYIGKNEPVINRFRQMLGQRLTVFSGYVPAGYCLSSGDGRALAFYEKSADPAADALGLKFLRANFKHLYIILITGPLNGQERKLYLQCGVNDTMSADITPEKLHGHLEFLARNQQAIVSAAGNQKQIREFHMPKGKRLFDIVFSLGALILLSPLMLAVAAAIRLESRGPVIYKSKRAGTNFRVFDFLKFRSMYTDADKHLKKFKTLNQYADTAAAQTVHGSVAPMSMTGTDEVLLVSDDYVIPEPEFIHRHASTQSNTFVKLENDPRVTRIGRFIRKYSIDELPQLFNILRGDMSVVGNRPLPLYEAELLTRDEYIDRFMAPAGLTGLWQVEKRGESGKLSPEERKQLDIEYARNFSPAMDLTIIAKTLKAFVQKENV